MRVFASVLFAASCAFAYQISFPNSGQDWNTTGPNYLVWTRVATDPSNFTGVLVNVNANSNQVMDDYVNGVVGIANCTPPQGGWPSGSGFRVNMVQDAQHLDTILAQSAEFNITDVSSNGSTVSSASAQTATSAVTSTTSNNSSATSSQTSTTPTGVSAASLSADTRASLLTVVTVLAALVSALF